MFSLAGSYNLLLAISGIVYFWGGTVFLIKSSRTSIKMSCPYTLYRATAGRWLSGDS